MPIMKVTKRVHHVWNEYKAAESLMPERYDGGVGVGRGPLVGKYQYVYESDDGKRQISLVELPDYFGDGVTLWEICSLSSDLFGDVERFGSRAEAEEKIKEYLD